MENKGLWQNSNSSTPSSFMQIYGDPRKKKQQNKTKKKKKKIFNTLCFYWLWKEWRSKY